MPFTVSPGISISEIDLTNIVPTVRTVTGATAGVFQWGPVDKPTLIQDVNTLQSLYFSPDEFTYESFYCVRDFLRYGVASCYVTRVANTSALNATTSNTTYGATIAGDNTVLIKNRDDYEAIDPDSGGTGLPTDIGPFSAKYPGSRGNNLKVSICGSTKPEEVLVGTSFTIADVGSSNSTIACTDSQFTSELEINDVILINSEKALVLSVDSDDQVTTTRITATGQGSPVETASRAIKSGFEETSSKMLGTVSITKNSKLVEGTGTYFTRQLNNGDNLVVNNRRYAIQSIMDDTHLVLKNPSSLTIDGSYGREWEFRLNVTGGAPSSTSISNSYPGVKYDAIHVIVVDEDGNWSYPGSSTSNVVLKSEFASVSSSSDDYYKTIINNSSSLWWIKHPEDGSNWGSIATNNKEYDNTGKVWTYSLTGGVDGNLVDENDIVDGFQYYLNKDYEISAMFAGAGTDVLASSVISIADTRRDCVAFVSPSLSDVKGVDGVTALENVISFRKKLPSSSYAVMDSGWKKEYDSVNRVTRFLPLNADIAAITVRTEVNYAGPFLSPAGFVRGQLNTTNLEGLVWNPTQSQRDELYKVGVNSVVTAGTSGTVLFGDKTLLDLPTAFDRINVRRLFLSLEKSISIAARASLFEFNDEFTRSQFVSIVEPFLRNIQTQGGITDYLVVCNETNNPASVVDANQFVGSVFVKPARSINFIELNFVAVRSDVSFNTVVQRG